MTYLISWTSKDPVNSAKEFSKSGHGLTDPDIKVLHSWHVVGDPSGGLLVETDKPELIHQAVVKWHPLLDVAVQTVISDEAATRALTGA